MASSRDQIKNILNQLGHDVLNITDNKLDKEVREVYAEEVEYMYSEHTPSVYKRRYDRKGFLDRSNWDTDVKLHKNGSIEYKLINETETRKPSIMRLDKMIETGKVHASIKARPVYARTMQRLKDENVVENILKSELKKEGWDFK